MPRLLAHAPADLVLRVETAACRSRRRRAASRSCGGCGQPNAAAVATARPTSPADGERSDDRRRIVCRADRWRDPVQGVWQHLDPVAVAVEGVAAARGPGTCRRWLSSTSKPRPRSRAADLESRRRRRRRPGAPCGPGRTGPRRRRGARPRRRRGRRTTGTSSRRAPTRSAGLSTSVMPEPLGVEAAGAVLAAARAGDLDVVEPHQPALRRDDEDPAERQHDAPDASAG